MNFHSFHSRHDRMAGGKIARRPSAPHRWELQSGYVGLAVLQHVSSRFH
jgi:hypothetical protein